MDPASHTGIDSHSIWEMRALEDYVEREDRRQHLLILQKASLVEQLRQKRRLLHARRALQWASTRTDGESHYIWHVGVLRYGAAIFISIEATTLMAGGLPNLSTVIAGGLTGAIFGLVGGLLTGMTKWDNGEARFARILAGLEHSPPRDPFAAGSHELEER